LLQRRRRLNPFAIASLRQKSTYGLSGTLTEISRIVLIGTCRSQFETHFSGWPSNSFISLVTYDVRMRLCALCIRCELQACNTPRTPYRCSSKSVLDGRRIRAEVYDPLPDGLSFTEEKRAGCRPKGVSAPWRAQQGQETKKGIKARPGIDVERHNALGVKFE